jgi:hypothetical protein
MNWRLATSPSGWAASPPGTELRERYDTRHSRTGRQVPERGRDRRWLARQPFVSIPAFANTSNRRLLKPAERPGALRLQRL